jgi:hypothetical protein
VIFISINPPLQVVCFIPPITDACFYQHDDKSDLNVASGVGRVRSVFLEFSDIY